MSHAEEILKEAERFPALDPTALNLLELLQSDDFETREVVDRIELNPQLTIKILRLANSGFFGLRREVTSVFHAVNLLGKTNLVRLLLSATVGPIISQALEGYKVEEGELWKRAIAVAFAARQYARRLNVDVEDRVFISGLLCDVGKLLTSSWVEKHLKEIQVAAFEEGCSFEEAEKRCLGVNHAKVGSILLDSWDLPDSLVEVVRWHHEPTKCGAEYRTEAELVHLADYSCALFGIGAGSDGTHYRPCHETFEKLHVDFSLLEKVMIDTMDELEKSSFMFESP